jgi:hypothetical protein
VATPPLRAALTRSEASIYLGFKAHSNWLLRSNCPVPRCDVREPGAGRAVWVWRVVDLDAFLTSRLVRPGETNPQKWSESP